MIYFDHNATTNLHPNAKLAMDEWSNLPLNASSIHANGRLGKSIIEKTRLDIASLLNIENYFKDYQITFTASGTEANNIVLSNFKDGEIFISSIEHPSIWMNKSHNVKIIAVDENGLVNLEDLEKQLRSSKSEKKLVSVMLANNETGVINDIKKIANIAHENNALMHSDCVQAAGKIDIDMYDFDVDFASISGHKFGGPVGAAALIHKTKIHLKPIYFGGGQERGLRSGTENVSAIAGFGAAIRVAKKNLTSYYGYTEDLRNKLEAGLLKEYSNVKIAALDVNRLPNTSLIMHPGKDSATKLIAFDMHNIAASAGSACSSGKVKNSYVLESMKCAPEYINTAIRVSLNYTNTEQEIDNFIKIYKEINK